MEERDLRVEMGAIQLPYKVAYSSADFSPKCCHVI